jgi:ATP-dependent RNA helicase RhlE
LSFTQFALDARLQQNIARAGYVVPTPIQLAAIPEVLAGHDLIGTAQTGTGKTAAFVLPILQALLAGPRNRSRALIVTPTRELAEQINDTVRQLAAGTKLRCATIYGGVGMGPQIRALRDGVEILVACPGRLLDHVEQGFARLDDIEMLVLDEADRMLDMGFMPSVRKILSMIPEKRQTMLFSATFPQEIEQLAAKTLRTPKRVTLGLSRPVHTVAHALYPVAGHLKTPLLLELLERTEANSVLVFTRTKHRAERLAQQIARAGRTVTSMHSNRSQAQRQSALNGFKSGRFQIMVATDIAARGIDVENISHVINYDMPDTADAYIHRIGRTGRAERTGDAYTMITREDESIIRTLERIMGKPLPRKTLADFDYRQPAPPREPNQPEQIRSTNTGRPRRDDDRPRRDDDRRSPAPYASSHRQQPLSGGTGSNGAPKRDGYKGNNPRNDSWKSAPKRDDVRTNDRTSAAPRRDDVRHNDWKSAEPKRDAVKNDSWKSAPKVADWKAAFPKSDAPKNGGSRGNGEPVFSSFNSAPKRPYRAKTRKPFDGR